MTYLFLCVFTLRLSSSVSMMIRLRVGRPTSLGSILGQGRQYSFLQDTQTLSGAHIASESSVTERSVPKGKSAWGVLLTYNLHRMLRLRLNAAVPLLPTYAFIVCIGKNLRNLNFCLMVPP